MSGHQVYNTPLLKKIGIKSDGFNLILNAPAPIIDLLIKDKIDYDLELLQNTKYHLIWLFTNHIETVESALKKYKDHIFNHGCIWISWYKKSSKLPTELNEDIIRDTALALGLVDIKVAAVDLQWSALKLVIPVKYRSSNLHKTIF